MRKMSKKMNAGKKKRIGELLKELENNDAILKKNKESYKVQVMVGLIQKGFPQSNGMYDAMLERMEFDLRESNLKIATDFRVANPVFVFQSDPEWQRMNLEATKKHVVELEANMKKIKEHIATVEKEIEDQNIRITQRNIGIKAELKKLGFAVNESNKSDYIQ
jgi:hypothetical protein